jgi:hypothetical protein
VELTNQPIKHVGFIERNEGEPRNLWYSWCSLRNQQLGMMVRIGHKIYIRKAIKNAFFVARNTMVVSMVRWDYAIQKWHQKSDL